MASQKATSTAAQREPSGKFQLPESPQFVQDARAVPLSLG